MARGRVGIGCSSAVRPLPPRSGFALWTAPFDAGFDEDGLVGFGEIVFLGDGAGLSREEEEVLGAVPRGDRDR